MRANNSDENILIDANHVKIDKKIYNKVAFVFYKDWMKRKMKIDSTLKLQEFYTVLTKESFIFLVKRNKENDKFRQYINVYNIFCENVRSLIK